MIHPSLFSSATWSQATSDAVPRVVVVDDDISVRESLELLIRSAGSEAETYTSAEKFLARPEV